MDQEITTLLSQQAKQTVLTDAERKSMRDMLLNHMSEHTPEQTLHVYKKPSLIESTFFHVVILGLVLFLLGVSISLVSPSTARSVRDFISQNVLHIGGESDVYQKLEI